MSRTGPTAFVHVDLDDLWAVADCYGLQLPQSLRHFVYDDAVPRLLKLFEQMGIAATFFVVGRDLEYAGAVDALLQASQAGHRLGNHSYSHSLSFRALDEQAIEQEVARTEALLTDRLGQQPAGFRAPGYGLSPGLLRVLVRRGYRYDSSLMPSPYGPVFRMLDAQLRRRAGGETGPAVALGSKTQYARLSEARAPLRPYPIGPDAPLRPSPGSPLIELPAAVAPLLRLPFQAGVCLRLGRRYFDLLFRSFVRRPDLPWVFLLHGVDLANLAALKLPFFERSSFFSMPVETKLEQVRYFLSRIQSVYRVELAEEALRAERS